MDLTNIASNGINSLEDYAIVLTVCIISFRSIASYHVQAVKAGILTEDLTSRANTILWDCDREVRLHVQQLETVLELLPEGFDPETIIKKLRNAERVKLRKKE